MGLSLFQKKFRDVLARGYHYVYGLDVDIIQDVTAQG